MLDKRSGLKGSDLEKEIQAYEKAIKALEQEFILDKIRAEIEQTSETVDGFFNARWN